MFIRSFFLLAILAACGLAGKAPRNRTANAHYDKSSVELVVYNGDPRDGSIYFNGTLDALEASHPLRKNGIAEYAASAAAFGTLVISIYNAGNYFSRPDAIGCVEGLRTVASQNLQKKHYSVATKSCNCMFKFGPNVVNDKNTAGETWFAYMKDRINDPSFKGSIVFEYDINGPDMIGAMVTCNNSWEGAADLVTRWAQGLRASGFVAQWTDRIKYFVKRG
ncbi:hypothetical protein BGX28_005847 [Mortierella sp. GBA30]|nr:hypothetical protein BGX28_005847 [Mortierella sp. GBA30]